MYQLIGTRIGHIQYTAHSLIGRCHFAVVLILDQTLMNDSVRTTL